MDEEFYYDEEAADRPIRFIEKYCQHYEGRFAGEPFRLLDWQKDQVIRPLFGTLRTDTGLRRYQELFLLSAKGSGKTPLLAAIGLYCLLADGEAAPHVISMASSFEQANLTFDAAKKYIDQSKALDRLCDVRQYKIRVPKTYGQWSLISGKPTGRSGSRPSCTIADECHEWLAPTAQTYNLITANLFKRQQPLLLVATNAPASSTSFCHHLYERAKNVLTGKSQDKTLLPVIFETPRAIEWTSEAAARAANPSIPEIITFDQLKPRLAKALETQADEAEYRRLYLSQQTQTANAWLDLAVWDSCTEAFDPTTLNSAVYVGIDATEHDDLFAVTYVYATASRFYVDAKFWLPRQTAERYIQSHAIPYQKWADDGYITLIDEPTISEAVSQRIAATIIATAKAHKVKAVCYDRARAAHTIANLESAGLTCVAVGQGWGVSNGCDELARRLKEKSIQIQPNKTLRACAEIVEVTHDQRGNYWCVKPNAKGRYAGNRAKKIDGIAALVTALTEARKHSFPSKATSAKAWIV